MKYEQISVEEALQEAKKLPFCFIQSLSEVYLGKNKEDKTIYLSEIIEARFFGENKEIKIFQKEDGLQGVFIHAEDSDNMIYKTYKLRQAKFGQRICVGYELKKDEDGQTYVAGNRLIDWEGEQ